MEWAARQCPLQEIAEGSGDTGVRLCKLIEIADRRQDEIRQSTWATRWHDAERR